MIKKWEVITDPYKKDLENAEGEYYYESDLLVRVYVKRISKAPLLARVKAKKVVNGASIPLLCQFIIPKSGKWNRPSGVHDAGFEDGGLEFFIDGEWKFIALYQSEVDYIYLKLMESREVPGWNRRTQYAGLRLGGWVKWNEYRIKNKGKAS